MTKQARKDAKKSREIEKKETNTREKAVAAENAKWAETDPKVLQKQAAKAEEARKREEAAKKREEVRLLQKKEEEELAKSLGKPVQQKMTLAMRREQRERDELERERQRLAAEAAKGNITEQPDLTENPNRQTSVDGEARTVDDALAVLSSNDAISPDRHPEKRMKAAFRAYEEVNLPVLRKENPSLRLGQIRNLLWDQWLKAPENPIVKAKLDKQGGTAIRNAKAIQ